MSDTDGLGRRPARSPKPQKSQRDPRWTEKGWGHKVTSQDELFRAVYRIGSLEGRRRYVWRGVRDARWRLQPSLVRSLVDEDSGLPTEQTVREREQAILQKARAWRLGTGPTGFIPDLQLLANLQHHGAPTRLLDVTANPMTALWFACQEDPDGRDAAGAVFAFDVTGVPARETMTMGTTSWDELANPAEAALKIALTDSERDRQPFLVLPTQRDERMQAQEGLFIAGAVQEAPNQPPGLEGFPFDAKKPPGADKLKVLFAPDERSRGRPSALPFCVLVIPPNVKRSVVPHLEGTFDRRESTLFPDLDGYVQALERSRIDLTVPATTEQPDPED